MVKAGVDRCRDKARSVEEYAFGAGVATALVAEKRFAVENFTEPAERWRDRA